MLNSGYKKSSFLIINHFKKLKFYKLQDDLHSNIKIFNCIYIFNQRSNKMSKIFSIALCFLFFCAILNAIPMEEQSRNSSISSNSLIRSKRSGCCGFFDTKCCCRSSRGICCSYGWNCANQNNCRDHRGPINCDGCIRGWRC